jgi:hypothetical protein
MTPVSVFVPVSVEVETPDKSGNYFCIDPNHITIDKRELYRFSEYNKSWYDDAGNAYHPSHWLKLLPDQYLFTKDELIRVLGGACEAAAKWQDDESYRLERGV